jgi:hypothetical protein
MSREGGLGGVEIEAYIEARGTKLRAKTMNRTGVCLVCLPSRIVPKLASG